MNELLRSINSLHLIKWSTAPWVILYLIAIFMMVYDKKRFNREEKTLGISMWIMLIIMYCPIMLMIFIPRILSDGHEYSRMGWGGITVPVIAFVLTVYISYLKETEHRKSYALPLLMALMLVLFAGEKTRSYAASPDNIYKIPQESIEIVELMDEYDTGKERPEAVVIHDLYSEDVQSPGEIGKIRLGIRGYSYKYLVPLGIPGKEEEYADSDFLITGNGEDREVLKKMRFKFIGSAGPCDIYVNPSYAEK